MKTISVNLSHKGLKSLKKELNQYKRDFRQNKVRLFMDTLAEKCQELVLNNIVHYGATDTGDLFDSIIIQKNKNFYRNNLRYFVVADSEHACFVEFGTGKVGEEAPYPYPMPKGVKWNYASGKHIFHTKDGKYGWIYYKDGSYWFTEGLPSRPFMHDASLRLEYYVESIAKEIFKS